MKTLCLKFYRLVNIGDLRWVHGGDERIIGDNRLFAWADGLRQPNAVKAESLNFLQKV